MIEENYQYEEMHSPSKSKSKNNMMFNHSKDNWNLHNTIVNKIYKDDIISTGYKSINSNKKILDTSEMMKTSNRKSSGKKFAGFVRPFGVNNLNINVYQNKNNNGNYFYQQNQTTNTFNTINNNISNSFNFKNISIQNNETSGFRPKKKILSTEEIIMERIEKEKQEIERLKKVNMENLGKIFHNNSSISFFNQVGANSNSKNNNDNSSSLLAKKRDNLFNQPKALSLITNNEEAIANYQKEDKKRKLPSVISSISNKEQPEDADFTMRLELDEDYMSSITDDLTMLSVHKSPQKDESYKITYCKIRNNTLTTTNNLMNNNQLLNDKQRKKEEKTKELKKQSIISKMNFSIFEKITFEKN